MKAAILGVGRMGTAICYAMNKLGFDVIGVDSYAGAVDNFRKHVSGSDGAFYLIDENKTFHRPLMFEKPDIVISSLPYHQTEEVGHWCNDNSIRYCDLGGRVDVSQNINEAAKNHGKTPVFTDLGLAPGLVNILAEKARSAVRGAESIEMFVGGLPKHKDETNPLKYETTWSIDGLINEYKDDCIILKNGEEKIVKGMEGHQLLDFRGEELEAFFTSGGASHTIKTMKEAGATNCSYKTLRYKGHRDIVRFLIRNCSLGDHALEQIFLNGCPQTEGGDRVLIHVNAKKGSLEWKKYIEVLSDDRFSAMQKATAFPISCVASLMATGELEGDKEQHRDYWTQYPKALTYKDVPFDKFQKLLLELDLEI